MNVSYRWLRDLARGLDAGPEELAERLAGRGAPVEQIRDLSEGVKDVVVARVLSVRRHPDADRLSLCEVETGGGTVSVVCGAPVIRQGGLYPFAPVGAELPGGVTIRRARIRGQSSEGMLCSERELALGRDQAGIMLLHGDFRPGQPLIEALALDDWRLDVEVTANRPDLLSHEGVAREAAPEGHGGLALPAVPGGPPPRLRLLAGEREVEANGVRIRIDEPELCPRYLGAVVRGVRVGPSPEWLAGRLRAAGARPINNVVDATNYVLLELGQPLHAFDLARLEGSSVIVRSARPNETLRTLDGEERRLGPGVLAICDARAPVAVAGIMGGEDSEVSEGTEDVLLECAFFDPRRVRAGRKALGMVTDASYRFERGVDPEGLPRALARAVEVLVAVAGGTPDPEVLDVNPRPWSRFAVDLRPERVERVLGVGFGRPELRALLEPLGFEVEDVGEGPLRVAVPGFRSHDVRREVDLIEEVARVHGYDRFPDELGSFRPGTVPDHPLFRLEDDLRSLLAARGFLEAHVPALVPEADGDVELLNPVSAQESRLRRSLLPGLLRRVEHNFARGVRDVRLFEIGTAFRPGPAGGVPAEETRVAVVASGARHPPHWSRPDEPFEIWDLKGVAEALCARIDPSEPSDEDGSGRVTPYGAGGAPLEDAETFEVRSAAGGVLGRGGRVAATAVDAPPWAQPVYALELVLPAVPRERPARAYRPVPPYPGVERDLALVVPDALPVGRVSDAIRNVAGELLEAVEVFDVYRGAGIPPHSRSVAFRLRFRSRERTLEDAEVDGAVEEVVSHVKEVLEVETRGR